MNLLRHRNRSTEWIVIAGNIVFEKIKRMYAHYNGDEAMEELGPATCLNMTIWVAVRTQHWLNPMSSIFKNKIVSEECTTLVCDRVQW